MATKQKSLGPESKRESRSFPSGGSFFICFDCSFCLCAAAKERASVLFVCLRACNPAPVLVSLSAFYFVLLLFFSCASRFCFCFIIVYCCYSCLPIFIVCCCYWNFSYCLLLLFTNL